MSERRCRLCGVEHQGRAPCYEPQEGASDGRPSRDTSASITAHRGSGAPSCDSPELAAIRVVVERGDYAWPADALLRMVDELTNAVRCETLNSCKWAREVDELRAKLADSQDLLKAEVHLRSLVEAKLAEASRALETNGIRIKLLTERAEAAEARMKELEAKLEDMVVVTDDPVCFND